jgi:hypothetical protein
MKVIMISRNGKAIAENCKRHIELWEGVDGYHPIDERYIFRDKEGLEEPHIIIFEGNLMPYGAKSGIDQANDISTVVLQSKFADVPLKNVSTRWGRLMAKILKFFPYIAIVVVLIIVVYVLFSGGYINV